MSFGLPCPEDVRPMEVFSGVEQYDATLASFVQNVVAEIVRLQTEAGASLAMAVDVLQRQVRYLLNTLNRLIGDVYTVLQSQVNSQTFVLNSSMSTAVTDIATLLQQTTQEVMYAPGPYQPQTPLFPPPSVPGATPSPVSPLSPFPPSTSPQNPPGSTPPPQFPGQSVTLNMDGVPVSVLSLCNQIQNTSPVTVNGNEYIPTVSVYNSGAGLQVDANGMPSIDISYSKQADGSLAVNVGPVYVVVSMPPTPSNPDAPACRLVTS